MVATATAGMPSPLRVKVRRGWLGRDVVVPEIVVDDLEMPDDLPVSARNATTEFA